MDVRGAKHRALSLRQRVKCHRNRNWNINTDHPGFNRLGEFARASDRWCENHAAVAEFMGVLPVLMALA